MVMQGIPNTSAGGSGRTRQVVERLPEELGTGQGLECLVGSRWAAVELESERLDIRVEQRLQVVGHRPGRQQHGHALLRPCEHSPLPSCVPSTPFGSP